MTHVLDFILCVCVCVCVFVRQLEPDSLIAVSLTLLVIGVIRLPVMGEFS